MDNTPLDDLGTTFSLHISPGETDGPMHIGISCEITEDFPDDRVILFQDIMQGIVFHLHNGLELLLRTGENARYMAHLEEELDEVDFEPSEDLLEAVAKKKADATECSEENVICFKNKLH